MALRGATLAVIVVVASACGSTSSVRSTVPPTSPASVADSTTTTAGGLVTDERGVAVVVTGVLGASGLCPVQQSGCRTPIAIEGVSGDAVADGAVAVARGWYDGARLLLAEPLAPGASPFPEPVFASLCPGMSNPADVDTSRTLEIANPVVGRGDGDSAVLAGAWIDQRTNVVTLWFARDLDRYRQPLLDAFGSLQVCLADGADFSEAELRSAMADVGAMHERGALAIQGGFGVDTIGNRVPVPIEALDPAGRAELDAIPGVVAAAFIELIDRPLSDLPAFQPTVTGTIDLITSSSRSDGGMEALGTFTLQYDAEANCLFYDEELGRTTIVWPFGFTASLIDGVAAVFAPNGDVVATAGVAVQMGGGWVGDAPLTNVLGDNRCGATNVFVANV